MSDDAQNNESVELEDTKFERKKDDILSFKEVGDPFRIEDLPVEFDLMRRAYGKALMPDHFRRVGLGSGTHLVKLTTPRADISQSILRVREPGSNRMPTVVPSVNAPDIPVAKIVYRPLRIVDHEARSVVDHILNPDNISQKVLEAFAQIFGDHSLTALRAPLLKTADITKLPDCGEFPIVFIPRPGGGDLQITPVSLATAFMGMKRVTDLYFQKQQEGEPRPPRGRWTRQMVSAKPQNISGAIGGPRVRFLATMPPSMTQVEAELYRYINGGSFPRWREGRIDHWVLRYADQLDQAALYNNEDIRAALDLAADRLIQNASAFIADTIADARTLARRHGFAEDRSLDSPGPASILIRRKWRNDQDYGRARIALTSPHFEHRLSRSHEALEN